MAILNRFRGGETSSKLVQVKEMIGRSVISSMTSFWTRYYGTSIDASRTDYAWWDKFRRGQQAGFEFSGLFAKPITETFASWVMGDAIEPRLVDADEYTDNLLQKFFKRIHGVLINMVIDLYGLGDQYVIVNPDGSLSIPSPELVRVEYDELDYRKAVKVTITTKLEKATVTDVYTSEGRTITIKWSSKERKDTEVFEFQNLIGKLPVVHFANDRSGNETNGRPIYESLRHLYSRYNDLIGKMVDGAELMGNPIPVIEGVDDVDATLTMLSATDTETFTDDDGVEQSRVEIYWDRLTGLVLGPGAHFKFASPGAGFTEDMRNTLKSLFILVMEHTRIPEAVWGLELSSARATAIEQMKTFHMYIQMKRLALEAQGSDDELGMEAKGGLLELCDIWLRIRALTDRQIKVGAVSLKWSNLTEMDDQLMFTKTESAHNKGVITDETYLKNLKIVEDVEAEVENASKQMQTEGDQFDKDVEDALDEVA